MNNFTFLAEDQIFGSNALEIFAKRGTKAAVTDFSILLGAFVSSSYYVNNGSNSLENRTGYYWTCSDDGANDARVVSTSGTSS